MAGPKLITELQPGCLLWIGPLHSRGAAIFPKDDSACTPISYGNGLALLGRFCNKLTEEECSDGRLYIMGE